jgi:hypothetical protein
VPDVADDRFEFVAGQVQGIIGVLLVLGRLHPLPERLNAEISAMEQAALARAESTSIGDDYLDGIRDVVARLQALLTKGAGLP